jgi:hypothetical protein
MKQALTPGSLVLVEVVAHHPWGVEVRTVTPVPGIHGTIDVMYVTENRPFEPFGDYPPVGRNVEAVVMPYPPDGRLRLSTRHSDIDRVSGQG